MCHNHRTNIMRREIEVTKLEDLRDGDVFQVGNEEWVWHSSQQEPQITVPGRAPWYGDEAEALADDLIRALGKVSRVVEVPEPPEGYRLATEEDRQGPKPETVLYWNPDQSRWNPLPYLSKFCGLSWTDCIYAIPATEQDSCTQTSKPAGIECEVEIVDLDTVVLRFPFPDAFTPGEKVVVFPKDEGEQTSKLPEIEGVVTATLPNGSPLVSCEPNAAFKFGTRVRIRIEEVQG